MRLNLNRSGRSTARLSVAGYCVIAVSMSVFSQRACPADAVGWRGHGNGEFKSLKSPTHWSRDEGIAWKRQMSATSLASPVVAGDFVFVMVEPNRLVCLRSADGELLWDRSHDYEAIFGAEKANELKRLHAESRKVHQQIAELQKELKTEQDADPKSDQVASLRDRITKLQQHDEELTEIPPPQTDATGNTASTPVCDMANVYTVLGNGIVSSHRFDGQRNWIKFIEKPMPRHSASPIISGNRLIVHLKQLVALDLATGEIVWKADTPPRNGTPVALTVGEQAVIVTPAGAVVRSDDGKVLATNLFDLAYCSPIARDAVIFAAERGRLLAVKLSPGEEHTIQTDVVWQTRGAQEDRLASPIVHGGLLFSVTGSGILDVVDIATGKVIHRKRLEMGEGRIDASLSLADSLLYVHSTNGTTVIVEPDRVCREVARNQAEGSSSSPFLIDERILFRTPTHIICIGDENSSKRR